MEPYIDSERFRDVQHRLKIQARDAVWWRDACLLYFQQFSRQSIPYEMCIRDSQYPPRIYTIPAGLLKAGKNTITIRLSLIHI